MANCLIAQSGGPTTVINASLAGVVRANQLNPVYDHVYGGLNGIEGILSIIDENYETILESLMNGYGLQEKEALKLYQNIWIYTHGIASLCVTGVCLFTQEEIDDMLTDVFISLLKKTKGV